MRFSLRLASPIISAAVATIVLTDFAIVSLAGREDMSTADRFQAVWPMVLFSGCATVLVMSFLYNALIEFIRELETREARANHLACHDALTGLPNRALLADRLDQAMARLRRDGEPVALLLVDIDGFKQVNDTLGHQAGDDLICEVARRLQALTREIDTVARLGGDEFAIVQCGARCDADVERLCDRILEAARAPVTIAGRATRVTLSIGASLIDDRSVNAPEALRRSDIALYATKQNGRDGFRLFCKHMDAGLHRSASIAERLPGALATGSGLRLDFQPQLCARSSRLLGVEALLRWDDAVLGPVEADEILRGAEEAGVADTLETWVFERVCAASARWPDISVSIDAVLLGMRSIGFADRMIAAAARHGAVPCRIELTIPERMLAGPGEDYGPELARLRHAGFRIALDDFGAGHAALGCLRACPVDKVRLSRAFVHDLGGNDLPVAVVRAVVALGHALQLRVAAVGVDTLEQDRALRAAGCDEIQGACHAPARSAAEIDAMLAASGSVRLTA